MWLLPSSVGLIQTLIDASDKSDGPTLEKSEKLPAILKFSDMNLSESLLMGLQDLQFEEPTKIQAEAIPQILNGGDLIGIAQTGTGKTGAFVIPVME
ncbi:MAG: DEAD/DEAH box helicase, partial [Bacteroidetes bacterium]|nr:DEAD/DEAH box helicase [Bacteroidota bacterium]